MPEPEIGENADIVLGCVQPATTSIVDGQPIAKDGTSHHLQVRHILELSPDNADGSKTDASFDMPANHPVAIAVNHAFKIGKAVTDLE